MNTCEACKGFSLSLLIALLTLPAFGNAGKVDEKKASVPARAPAAKGISTGNKPGATAHGPTTAGHGPTTASPHGVTTSNPHRVTTTTNGRGMTATHVRGPVSPRGDRTIHTANGSEVRMRPNGRAADVHVANRGMDIHHGLNGSRRVEVIRADHSRIVADRHGQGFVDHPYFYHGHEFAHRTYYYNGRVYDHYYGRYYYHGAYVHYYTPVVYYRPAFYGWVYNPWVAPAPYAWGWGAYPWYGYYGFYFAPYPVYPSASFWLTDYLISASLAAAYQAQVDAAAAAAAQSAPAGAVPLTPEVKAMIAAEVQRQIALENAEAQSAQAGVPDPASSSVQRMLTDNVQHVFVAGRELDVVDTAGAECAVSEGDALQLIGAPPPGASAANLVVLSTKGGPECARGDTISVQLADLQDMQNHMRETIDQGMGELQTKQGHGNLPSIPTSAAGQPVKAAFASGAPPPDPNAGSEINQQTVAADQAEKQVLAQTQQNSAQQQVASAASPAPLTAPPAPPTEISMGQSVDAVKAALGQPAKIVDLGAKKIYVYKDMKITFKDGKVSDVQ